MTSDNTPTQSQTATAGAINRRIDGCLLDWIVPQADVDWWEGVRQRYNKAGRPEEAPEGEWTGMKAQSTAAWDPSLTLQWEIDSIDHSRDMYPMHLEAATVNGVGLYRRNLGYFVNPAEARLFAAALLLTGEQPSLDDALRDAGFTCESTNQERARWERSTKSGYLSLSIVAERGIGSRHHFDRELHLIYAGNRAKRVLPIARSCASWGGANAGDPLRVPHPATGTVDDPLVADFVAALAIADARLALGNIRTPLADGQEVAFIEEMIARRDAAPAP